MSKRLTADQRDALNSMIASGQNFTGEFINTDFRATIERQHFRITALRTAQRTPLNPNGESSSRTFRLRDRDPAGKANGRVILAERHVNHASKDPGRLRLRLGSRTSLLILYGLSDQQPEVVFLLSPTETSKTLTMKSFVGKADIVFVTLDTLRWDVADSAMRLGLTPNLQRLIPHGWELRHSPGSFTYAAHHAFFAGFLPTPVTPGPHPRLFAARFPGSETTTDDTWVFDEPDVVSALAGEGYHTICVGGVGFFNRQSPLGSVLPGLFQQSFWSRDLGVTERDSTRNQVNVAIEAMTSVPRDQRVFLFINVSALHQPNCMYVDGAKEDSAETQRAALAYVDSQLAPLLSFLQHRSTVFGIICSDHGTAYGEDGYVGHRLAHPVVWNVPYAEFSLPKIG